MSTQELARIDESVSVRTLGDIFVKSGFFKDTRDQYQAVVKILYGKELGFSPVVSMMGIHIIDGKPSISANLIGTLVKRSGRYNYRVIESTATRCEITFFELNGSAWESAGTSVFTMDDAKQAGLTGKQNWQKYPKAMLYSRALSAGVKLHCPDVSASPLYVPEELGAEVNEDGEVLELPKSARNVERTTEETPIEKPRAAAAKATPPPVTNVPQTDADVPALPPVSEVDYITVGQAKNFAITFKNALRKELQKDSDGLKHDWLKQQGIVNVLGAGSALAIRADSFFEVRDSAEAFARSL